MQNNRLYKKGLAIKERRKKMFGYSDSSSESENSEKENYTKLESTSRSLAEILPSSTIEREWKEEKP
jgi:predicted transcriptional regulator